MEISEDELNSWIPSNDVLAELMDPHEEFRRKYLAELKKRIFSLPGDKRLLEDIVLRILVKPHNKGTQEKAFSNLATPLDDIKSWESFYLAGESGSGKTSYLKRLCLFAEKAERWSLPAYINLKDDYDGTPLDEFILKQIGLPEFKWVIKDMLKKGKFEIFLDGYDEMDGSLRQGLYEQIRDAMDPDKKESPIRGNRMIIAGRDVRESDFPWMQRYAVQPLDKADIVEYLKAKDARSLLSHMQDDRSMEFFKNPLLLNYLIELYNKEGAIRVRNKSGLYRKVVENRFIREQRRIIGGDSESILDFSDEMNMLTKIGYLMHTGRKEEFTHDLRNLFDLFPFLDHDKDPSLEKEGEAAAKESKEKYGIASDIYEVIFSIEHSMLFRFGKGRPEFDHLSLQEYFCARWFYGQIMNNKISIRESYDRYWSEKEGYERIKEYVSADITMEQYTNENYNSSSDREEDYKRIKEQIRIRKESIAALKEGKRMSEKWSQVLIFLAGMLNENGLNELLETVTETYLMNSDALRGIGNNAKAFSAYKDLFFATELIRNSKNRGIDAGIYSDKLKEIIRTYGCNNERIVRAISNLHDNSDIMGFLIDNEQHFKVYHDGSVDSVFNIDGTVSSIDHEPNLSIDDMMEEWKEKEFKMDPQNYDYQIGFLLALFASNNPKAKEFLDKAMPQDEFPDYKHVTVKSLDYLADRGHIKAEKTLKAQVDDLIAKFESETGSCCQKYASDLFGRAVGSRLDSRIAMKYMKDYVHDKGNKNRKEIIETMKHIDFGGDLKAILKDADEPFWKEALETYSHFGYDFVCFIEENTDSHAMLLGGRHVPFRVMLSSIKSGMEHESKDHREKHNSVFYKHIENTIAYHWDVLYPEKGRIEDEPELMRFLLHECRWRMAYPLPKKNRAWYEVPEYDITTYNENAFERVSKWNYEASQEVTYSYTHLDRLDPISRFVVASMVRHDVPWRRELMNQMSEMKMFDTLRIFTGNENDPDRDYAIGLLREKGEWKDG